MKYFHQRRNVLHLGMVLILLPAGVALTVAPLCDDIVAQEYVCVSPNLLAQRVLFCTFVFGLRILILNFHFCHPGINWLNRVKCLETSDWKSDASKLNV